MIEARNLSFRYPAAAHPALQDVSLYVEPGEVVGVVGPNGSGKSTLGRLLKGLLLPGGGTARVDGLEASRDSLRVGRLVGLVFQNPNSQIVNSVVEQEVAFGPENLGLPTPEVRRRVDEALRAFGLEGRATAESHGLSMADKQRVALAAVIAMQPRYLILDEPTTWLEPRARWPLLEQVLTWAGETEAGVILVTHRMEEAQACDRLYGLRDGRLEGSGTPEQLLNDERLRARLALDLPETLGLGAELRSAGLPVDPGAPISRLAETLCPS